MTIPLLEMLREGDLRTTGRADEAAALALSDPRLVEDLFAGLTADHPGVRMRSADALQKVCATHPALLQPHAERLVAAARAASQQEVQWHAAQMLAAVDLTPEQALEAASILEGWFHGSKSSIVRTFSLQAVADLSNHHPALRPLALSLVEEGLTAPAHSVLSRARKIKKQMEKNRA